MVSLRRRKMKVVLITLAAAVSLFILILAIIHTYVINSYKSRIISPNQASESEADCILVLGAGVWTAVQSHA